MTIQPTTAGQRGVLGAVAAAAAAGGLAFALAACSPPPAAGGTATGPARTITAAATGTVRGTPDTLTITLGVESGGPSARDAMATNATRAAAVIDALKAAGVPAEELQTAGLNVFPTIDGSGRITGYRVSNMVTARLHELERAGAVIDAAAGQAGNDIRIQGMAFSIEDTGALMSRARRDAVEAARTEARELGRGAQVRVGDVRTVTEHRRTVPGPMPFAYQAGDALVTTPIEPGSQQVQVEVTVVFDVAGR